MNSYEKGMHRVLPELTENLLSQGIRVRIRVSGRSMAPLITTGDAVILQKVRAGDLKPGHLVFYADPCRKPVLHRILRIDRIGRGRLVFRTKGDAQGMMDEPVAAAAVLGRVVRIERCRPGLVGRNLDLNAPLWRVVAPLLAQLHLGINRLWTLSMRLCGRIPSRRR